MLRRTIGLEADMLFFTVEERRGIGVENLRPQLI
jgi:hypothetical protein